MDAGKTSGLYAEVNGLPEPVSAHVTKNVLLTSQTIYTVTTEWSQSDLVRGSRLRLLQPWTLMTDSNDQKSIIPGAIVPVSGELISKHSPFQNLRAVVRETGTHQLLEVWNSYGLSKCINLTALNKHGKVYNDAQFGCLAWSTCESKLLYVAEKSKDTSLETLDGLLTNVKDRSVYCEDWGEALTNKSVPVICVVNLQSGTVTVLQGVPPDVSPGQALWVPGCEFVFFVGWYHEPFRLGLKFCSNRRSALFKLDMDGHCERLTGDNLSVSCPRLSLDDVTLIYLQGEVFGPHNQCLSLQQLDLKSGKTSTLLEVINRPQTSEFAGVYEALAPCCWSEDGQRLVFSSACRNRKDLFMFDRRSNKVTTLSHRKSPSSPPPIPQLPSCQSFYPPPPLCTFFPPLPSPLGPPSRSTCWPSNPPPFPSFPPSPAGVHPSLPLLPPPLSPLIPPPPSPFPPLPGHLPPLYVSPPTQDPLSDPLLSPPPPPPPSFPPDHQVCNNEQKGVFGSINVYGSWKLLTVQKDLIVVCCSSPTIPPTLRVGFLPSVGEEVTWITLQQPTMTFDFEWMVLDITPPPEDNTHYSGLDFGAILVKPKPICSHHKTKIPLVVFIHGGPHSQSPAEWNTTTAGLVKLGFAVLMVNYRGSTGFGQDSILSLIGQIGSQDVEDVQRAVLTALEMDDTLDPKHLAVMGGSHGGFLSCHLIGQYPEFYRACVVRNPVINAATLLGTSDITDWRYTSVGLQYSYDKIPTAEDLAAMLARSPITHVHQIKTPVLLMLGGKDRRVSPHQGLELYKALKSRALPVRLLWFPEDGHSLSSVDTQADCFLNTALWLQQHLLTPTVNK